MGIARLALCPRPRTMLRWFLSVFDRDSFFQSRRSIIVASIKRDSQSGIYRIQFCCFGRQYIGSLKTKKLREVRGSLGRAEETLLLIDRDRLEVPMMLIRRRARGEIRS